MSKYCKYTSDFLMNSRSFAAYTCSTLEFCISHSAESFGIRINNVTFIYVEYNRRLLPETKTFIHQHVPPFPEIPLP